MAPACVAGVFELICPIMKTETEKAEPKKPEPKKAQALDAHRLAEELQKIEEDQSQQPNQPVVRYALGAVRRAVELSLLPRPEPKEEEEPEPVKQEKEEEKEKEKEKPKSKWGYGSN
jgi:hypothetical protein